jgi:hypothetical protein
MTPITTEEVENYAQTHDPYGDGFSTSLLAQLSPFYCPSFPPFTAVVFRQRPSF